VAAWLHSHALIGACDESGVVADGGCSASDGRSRMKRIAMHVAVSAGVLLGGATAAWAPPAPAPDDPAGFECTVDSGAISGPFPPGFEDSLLTGVDSYIVCNTASSNAQRFLVCEGSLPAEDCSAFQSNNTFSCVINASLCPQGGGDLTATSRKFSLDANCAWLLECSAPQQ
jgi:hypothetical protein